MAFVMGDYRKGVLPSSTLYDDVDWHILRFTNASIQTTIRRRAVHEYDEGGFDMSITNFFWGLLVVGTGMFMCVYGNLLFRFALAAMGFGVGFLGAFSLLEDQGAAARFLVSLAIGGIAALLLYSLVKFGIYFAGAILGLVAAFGISSLISIIGPNVNTTVVTILGIIGICGGGFLAPRIGNLVILLATSAAGAFMVISGFQVWFSSEIGADKSDPASTLNQSLSLTIFAVIFGIAASVTVRWRGPAVS